jgi:hypothetical protein
LRAVSVGPAAAPALARTGAAVRVHSVFPATVNLRIQGADCLVALTGPRGAAYPQAVALERAGDVGALGLAPGNLGRVGHGWIRVEGEAGWVTVDLAEAGQRKGAGIPRIGRAAGVRRACADHLAGIQARLGTDLRVAALAGQGRARTALGEALGRAALALGAAAGLGPGSARALHRAVAGLVGLGSGLTPSGDDFLSGFMAAARAREPEPPRRQGLVRLLDRAVAAHLDATGEISASLLRGAIRGHWPVPLADLALALAGERSGEALAALDRLCALGHSSGADLATGFLFGLDTLPNGG